MVASLAKAGIKVKPNPIEVGQYYSIVFDPDKAGDIMWAGWGPDWPNASTVIPELFTPAGGFNLSQVDDKAYTAKVQEAKTNTDRGSAVRAVEGAEQGGHAERVCHPDPVRPLAVAWLARRSSRPPVTTATSTSGRRSRRGRTRPVRRAVGTVVIPARPIRSQGGGEISAPPDRRSPAVRSIVSPRVDADPAGGTDHGFVHRPAAGRHGPHADRPQHDRLPALQRPARRPGAADLRQGLHPRRSSRPTGSGWASTSRCTSSTASSSRASSPAAPTAPAPRPSSASTPCLGYSFRRASRSPT